MAPRNQPGAFLTMLREIVWRRPPKPAAEPKPRPARPPLNFARLALGAVLEILAVSAFFAILWILVSPLLSKAGYAPGFDVPAHMYVTQRLAEGLRAAGRLPTIDPLWYAGLEITHKLPPIVYIPLTAVYLLTNNAMLTSRILIMGLLGLMGMSMYLVVRLTNGRLKALGAAVAITFSGAAVDPNWGVIASYTRFFGFTLFPLAIYCAKRLLDGRLAYTWALSIIIALMLPSHPMIAGITVIWLSAYAACRLLLERRPLAFLKYFFFAYVLATLIATWYLGPYIFEEPVWGSTLPIDVIALYSLNIGEQLKQFGAFLAVLVVGSLVLNFSRQRLALFLASLFSFVYALGVFGPLLALPRMLNLAYPMLSYFAGITGLTYLVFTSRLPKGDSLISWLKYAGVGAVAAVLVVCSVYETVVRTDFRAFRTTPFSNDEIDVAARLRREKTPGRVMTLSPAFPRYGLEMLMIPLKTKKPSPDGQYAVIAPFYLQKTQFYDDLKRNYMAVGKQKLRRWNTNYVLITPSRKKQGDRISPKFKPLLKVSGFKRIYQNSSFQLFKRRRPTAYIQKIGEQTLVIGRFAPAASAIYPDSIVTEKSFFIDDYTLADLKPFPTLLLYGFAYRNRTAAETLLKAYMRQGGAVIVDMQALDEYAYEQSKVIFNVVARRKKRIGTVRFKTAQPNRLDLPELKPISFKPSWTFLYYRNLDRKLVKATAKGKNYSVVGYKKVGRSKVYFIGGDLLAYGFNKHRRDIVALVDRLITVSRTKPEERAAVDIITDRFTPEKMVFSYRANRPWPALISRTYSPHWRARLAGGKRKAIIKTEGLMEINLPRGKHKVILWYGPTSIHPISKIITLIAWVCVLYMIFRWRRLDIKDVAAANERTEVRYS